MDDNARAFARNMFRLRVHESDGQAYEDLFIKVMGHARPRFRPVKAYGNIGDKKNDGFDSRVGAYYQVYAPDDIRKTQGDGLKKLKADFKGLKAFWHKLYAVKKFYFVINDKYQGVQPLIEKELSAIQKKHSLEEADVLLAKDLESILFALTDDVIISVVGHVPAINAGEFLFLSGFSYFFGAWIEFEKTARNLLEQQPRKFHPYSMMEIIRTFKDMAVFSQEDTMLINTLRMSRNRLVHGDSQELPPKEKIDQMVMMTEKLKGIKSVSPGST